MAIAVATESDLSEHQEDFSLRSAHLGFEEADTSPEPDAAPTNGDSGNGADDLGGYLAAIGREPLLTAAEERALARRVCRGDANARNQMIERNLRLVVSVAKRYQGYGLALEDLIQVGNEGLMRAVSKFDPERGTKLSTYAVPWIEQFMQRALANEGRTIRLPVERGAQIRAMRRAETRLASDGHEPTSAEIANAIDSDPVTVEELRRLAQPIVSLDKPLSDDGDGTLGDLVPGDGIERDEELMSAERAETINEAIAALPRRERRVLELRFGLGREGGVGHTLARTAKVMRLTRQRVRQLEREAMRHLEEAKQLAALQEDAGV